MMGGGLVDLTITALYIRCQCNRDHGSKSSALKPPGNSEADELRREKPQNAAKAGSGPGRPNPERRSYALEARGRESADPAGRGQSRGYEYSRGLPAVQRP